MPARVEVELEVAGVVPLDETRRRALHALDRHPLAPDGRLEALDVLGHPGDLGPTVQDEEGKGYVLQESRVQPDAVEEERQRVAHDGGLREEDVVELSLELGIGDQGDDQELDGATERTRDARQPRDDDAGETASGRLQGGGDVAALSQFRVGGQDPATLGDEGGRGVGRVRADGAGEGSAQVTPRQVRAGVDVLRPIVPRREPRHLGAGETRPDADGPLGE